MGRIKTYKMKKHFTNQSYHKSNSTIKNGIYVFGVENGNISSLFIFFTSNGDLIFVLRFQNKGCINNTVHIVVLQQTIT